MRENNIHSSEKAVTQVAAFFLVFSLCKNLCLRLNDLLALSS